MLLATPAAADMFPDGRNAKLPEARLNLGVNTFNPVEDHAAPTTAQRRGGGDQRQPSRLRQRQRRPGDIAGAALHDNECQPPGLPRLLPGDGVIRR